MKPTSIISLLAAATVATARSLPRATLPPYIFTVGDSTVTETAGWGKGFRDYLTNGANGENLSVSGTTTKSWQSNGRWKDLLKAVAEKKTEFRPIVTLQFGHNDQKETSGVTIDQYRANLVSMADQLQAAGATPIVITPITRRTFKDGKVRQDFVEWREIAVAASKEAGAEWLDLTDASTKYVNAIGDKNAQKYNWGDAGTDKTHLNLAGSKVFGRMVVDLLLEKRPDLATYFKANKKLTDLIAAGKYADGSE